MAQARAKGYVPHPGEPGICRSMFSLTANISKLSDNGPSEYDNSVLISVIRQPIG
jgi:hypothetical protein